MRIGQTDMVGNAGRVLLSTALVSSLGVASVEAAQCYEDGLRAPIGYYQIPEARDGGSYDCKVIEPYQGSMSFTSKYEGSDSARNELNEDAYQAYLDATKTIRGFEKTVIAGADDYQVDGDGPAARDCVLENLDTWAQADALLPDEINHVGQAVRKWALAAAANAYLRVKLSSDDSALATDRLNRIEAWFDEVANGVRGYYTDREPRKVNNHDYWAAWAVMATSVATENCDHWNWSMSKFEEAMGQISSDGYLPKELSRQDRALEYLNYAMQPLTAIAVFAEVNGVSVHEQYGNGFATLAQNVVTGLDDSSAIEAITGYPQITDGLHTAWGLAWMRPWTEIWGDLPGMNAFMTAYGPVKNTRLGGDIEFLYRVDPRWPTGRDPFPPGEIRLDF
ncbi:alginate lyase family protein [Marinobacter sp. M216]|uniref:Alginate lyase family protein n=1 Tax=Marinobacter albus TaxID=3030833 RepID=A0ABT7HFE8_9GAMM|nr:MULTISPECIES: alginate lyase family protein [unclassified Marinobacter]MBW7472192.1 alginate lyase family protein [Marinobacter sp. F4218]MDK9558762.1 alginate lyase family protein [Marinobacter sp. M216]